MKNISGDTMAEFITARIWKNIGSGQKGVTIPKYSPMKAGDHVIVKLLEG